MTRMSHMRWLLPAMALLAAGLLGGCVVYPAYPSYGYYGGPYGGGGGGAVIVGGGGGWRGGGGGWHGGGGWYR